jgi:hypothetical protein
VTYEDLVAQWERNRSGGYTLSSLTSLRWGHAGGGWSDLIGGRLMLKPGSAEPTEEKP